MTQPAIKVEGLWKEYTVGAAHDRHTTFYDLLSQTLKAPFQRLRALGGSSSEAEQFFALRDVNFEVQPGEVLGIIGRNGAGKSTLLKILSRITAPTKGRIEVRGKLASLLEVGTGFHPELSGRENIFLNGAILGMTRKEVAKKLDEIVAFAEIERFIDTPVKRYSSGMYVRLAFAVAANIEADALLVDEVLAVGDAEFQKRCLDKMEEVANGGRTVVFVSHNISAIRSLCSKGLLLKEGRVENIGPIGSVLENYANEGNCSINEKIFTATKQKTTVASLNRVAVRQKNGTQGERLSSIVPVHVIVDMFVHEAARVGVFIHCYDEQQIMVFSSGSFFDDQLDAETLNPGAHRFICEIPGRLLNDGNFALDVMLVRNRNEVFANEASIIRFRIDDDFAVIPGWQWRPAGVIRPHLNWKHQVI